MAASTVTGTSVSGPITGTTKTLKFETGILAPQSQGAVVATIGETTVLATANAASGIREGIDFFPLTVDVEERMYAAGKIPGSFFRREGRPADTAILTARLIDRPLRPSFADGYRNETQVVITVLGADLENPHDVLAINAASAALMLSGIPFEGPIGAVRIAWNSEGEWVPHPTYQEGDGSAFELVVAGRQLDDGDVAIMMVEAGGTEAAWEMYQSGTPHVTEEAIADGLAAAKAWIRESVELQKQLVADAGARPPLSFVPQVDYGQDVADRVAEVGRARVDSVTTITAKAEREAAESEVAKSIVAELAEEFAGREGEIKAAVRSLTKKLVRERIVASGVRIDGRGPTDIRPLSAAVGIVPTAHGSGLFQRGETQVLNITTLGMPRMDQLLDTIGVDDKKRYMHHYNMPPYANGETGRVGSPKRREIGHGLLAERALLPVVPPVEEFPYALRLVSEVLSSNGSTSMGSVCSSSLSLMDAGVPIKAPVAGIAMGLVKVDDRYITLTDILGAEDAFGDMDFKVAGTTDFVTALQLDTKIDGLPADVLGAALRQAYDARVKILEVMNEAISTPRDDVRDTAPKIVSIEIPIEKIGEVIGPKGKVINALQQETGTDIAVDDDGLVGTVTIGAKDGGAVAEARRRIEMILDPPKAEVGATYTGRVVNITKFGAFVNILPGRDGLVHISKLGRGKRVERVEDVVDLGHEIEVRVDDIDPQGKVSLSLAGDPAPASASAPGGSDRHHDDEQSGSDGGSSELSFEASWEEEATATFGNLGPASAGGSDDRGGDRGGDRGPRRNTRRRRP
ncbi:MAG TPA: polyribonucleotide nucleotidyltransferase [Acidimicrobiales bacterium]|jgi:polyribonucleotide nucleotidyltransferase|nr:polyribonucleotide nucleotidyltransferase [Acidimicrobiales bacterium]